MPAPLKVRGLCRAGHVTDATADKGRTTWRGKCATPNCEHDVIARRIPRDRIASTPTPTDADPRRPDDPHKVIKVTSYAATDHRQHPAGLTVTPGGDPGPTPGPERPGPAGPQQATDPDPVDVDEPRPGRLDRFRGRLAARPDGRARGPRPWDHPLGI